MGHSRDRGLRLFFVTKDSATNGLYNSQSISTIQINDNHSRMVKFSQGGSRTSVMAESLRDIIGSGFPHFHNLANRSIECGIGSPMVSNSNTSLVRNGLMPSKTLVLGRSLIDNDSINPDTTLLSLQAPERDSQFKQINPVHTPLTGCCDRTVLYTQSEMTEVRLVISAHLLVG